VKNYWRTLTLLFGLFSFCGPTSAMELADIKAAWKKIDLGKAGDLYFVRVGDGDSPSQGVSASAPRTISYGKNSITISKPSTNYHITVSADKIVSISHKNEAGNPIRVLIQ